MGNKGLIIAIVVILAVFSIPLLGTMGKSDTPEEVTTKYNNANTSEAVKPLVTAKSWEASKDEYLTDEIISAGREGVENTVKEATINGNEASVPVRVRGTNGPQNKTVLLRKEEGKWLVYAINMSFQGMDLTMNYENPEKFFSDIVDEGMKMMPEEMRAQITPEVKQMMIKQTKQTMMQAIKDGA